MSIKIIKDNCNGCKLCIKSCPFDAISIKDNAVIIDLEKCNLCGACVEVCKFDAIEIKKETEAAKIDLGAYKDIWVFAEQKKGKIQSVVYELLNEGRSLADKLGVRLCAVLLGKDASSQINELTSRGAEIVYLTEAPELENYQAEPYTRVLIELINEYKPEIILGGATSIGRSLLPRIAARINAGLTADCTGLAIDDKEKLLLQTRPAFGGNIMATIICPKHRPQMATVRHKVFKEALPDNGRGGKLIKKSYAAELLSSRTRLIDLVEEIESTVNLAEADIIVSGGRGLQKPENFHLIRELAETLGGAVGASRAAVDSDWIPYSHQVGQTGKTVCPKIYIACGISGQIQHLAGMQSSGIIVAINKDPSAPIFNVCTYGIVGDLFEVVPALIEQFRKAFQSK